MDDLISRQAAIDATWEEPSYTDPLNVLTEVRDRLRLLPPADTDLSAYSDKLWRAAYERGRKEAERKTDEECERCMMEHADSMEKLETELALTKRKRGKWTKENACEFCGFQPWYERDIHTLSFCPHCGADMREKDND